MMVDGTGILLAATIAKPVDEEEAEMPVVVVGTKEMTPTTWTPSLKTRKRMTTRTLQ